MGAKAWHHSNKKLLVAKGIATRSKKLVVAPGLTTRNKKLLGGSFNRMDDRLPPYRQNM